MSKVYVVNKSSHDFSKAEVFGEVVFLSRGSINRFNTTRMHSMFVEALEGSSGSDYLLMTGMSIMNSIACSIFAAKHGRLNILLYKEDGENSRYVVRRLILEKGVANA